jgi:hypothetical protein
VRHPTFARDGIMFGTERLSGLPIQWFVADPGRHIMEIWRKSGSSMPDSGRRLGASAFTNGPFSDYGSGHLLRASVSLLADFVPPPILRRNDTGSRPWDRPDSPESTLRSAWQAANVYHYQATTPIGFVVGEASGVTETRVARPRLHYFGRWGGHTFEDYEIAQGDPFGLSEAVGGLFRGVADYRPYMLDRFLRVGFWGLAPLKGDPVLDRVGMAAALDEYAGSGHDCRGVVVFAGGWANTLRLTQMLASIRVKNAVQIDGSDSLLLGRGNQLILGGLMPPWKQILQRWGIQLRAHTDGATTFRTAPCAGGI